MKYKNIMMVIQSIAIIVLAVLLFQSNQKTYEQVFIKEIIEINDDMMRYLNDFDFDYKLEDGNLYVVEDQVKLAKYILLPLNYIESPDYTWTDIYANTSFTMTSDVKAHQINNARAVVISSGLETLDWIESAIVDLYIPDVNESQLEESKHSIPSKASVLLEIIEDYQVTDEDLEVIIRFLVNSVADLDEEHISIIDIHGNVLKRK